MYLHGTPYSIAPDEQTHVPMIFWASDKMQTENKLNLQCLQTQANSGEYSHDNYFHSILGLMDIKTSLYNLKQDIFANCRH